MLWRKVTVTGSAMAAVPSREMLASRRAAAPRPRPAMEKAIRATPMFRGGAKPESGCGATRPVGATLPALRTFLEDQPGCLGKPTDHEDRACERRLSRRPRRRLLPGLAHAGHRS